MTQNPTKFLKKQKQTLFKFVFVLFAFICAPFIGQAQLSVQVDNTTSTTSDNVSTLSLSHTINVSNPNRLLMVGISMKRNATDVTATVTYGGAVMAQLITQTNNNNANNGRVAIYYLLNPPVGTNNVVANFNVNPDLGVVIGATSFYNVNNSPFGTPIVARGNNSAPSVSVTSVAGDIVYDMVSATNRTVSVGANQTQLFNAQGDQMRGASSTETATSTSTTMSWTASGSSNWAIAAVAIKAACVTGTVSQSCGPRTITVTNPLGGSGTYQYSINSGTWQNSNTFSSLAIGTYTVQIRDANNTSCASTITTVEFGTPDSDGDCIPDNLDYDDDNDGILDANEYNFCSGNEPGTQFFFEDFGTGTGTTSTTYTDYVFNTGMGAFPTSAVNDGEYEISNTIPTYFTWSGGTDHTGNTNGRMAIFNADLAPGEFYRRPVIMPTFATVTISFWVKNIQTNTSYILPNITAQIRNSSNTVIGSVNTNNISYTNTWVNFTFSFSVQQAGTYDLVLVNNASGGSGNDLAIDDIRATQVFCDLDGDGIPNVLDTDNDNDGCPDVLEGGANFVQGASYISSNRLNTTVNSVGVPTVPSGTSGYTTSAGQTIGGSLVAAQLTVITPPSNVTVVAPNSTSLSIVTDARNNTSWNTTTPFAPVYASANNGSADTRYQWYYGNPTSGGTLLSNITGYISGVTTSTLTISNSTGLRTGSYCVQVTHLNNDCINVVRCANITNQQTQPDINLTYKNVSVSGNVSTNDNVVSGTTYGTSPTLTSGPSGGSVSTTLTMNSNGSYTFVTNTPGVYTYTVPVCAPSQTPPCPSETLTITVLDNSSNAQVPVANPDIVTALQGTTPIVLSTLANDKAASTFSSLNASSVTIVSGTAPNTSTQGTLSVNTTTGNITFTPVSTFVGTVSYRYQVCDNTTPTPLCTSSFQEITVYPTGSLNSTLAVDDYAFVSNSSSLNGDVVVNDIDPESNTLTVTAQSTTISGKGSLVLNTNGTYTFTPVLNFVGPVNFPYTMCDNGTPQACSQATLYILVEKDQQSQADVNQTYINVSTTGNVSTNDFVPTGTSYGTSPTLASGPTGGSVSTTLTMNSNGTYTFVTNTPGVYIYNVPVCIPLLSPNCPTETLTITVLDNSSNAQPPIANPDMATALQGTTPIVLQTLLNDKAATSFSSINPASVTIVSGTAPNTSTQGTLSVNTTTGDITFTPVSTFVGTVSYQYEVCDNSSPTPLCATSFQEITVYPTGSLNSTLAVDDYVWVSNTNTSGVGGNVLTNDKDPEGNSLTVTYQSVIVNNVGSLVLNTNGSYTFTPVSTYHGPVNFPYTMCDNGTPQACSQATLYILVEDITALPVHLINFTAACVSNAVELKWSTAMETNSQYFEVQKSNNGSTWKPIATINAQGMSNEISNYQYNEPVFAIETSNNGFYRLKMVDQDGSYEYSNITYIDCQRSQLNNIKLYPNPINDYLEIASTEMIQTVEILTIEGKILIREEGREAQQKTINTSELAPGMYILKVNGVGYRLIKQ